MPNAEREISKAFIPNVNFGAFFNGLVSSLIEVVDRDFVLTIVLAFASAFVLAFVLAFVRAPKLACTSFQCSTFVI